MRSRANLEDAGLVFAPSFFGSNCQCVFVAVQSASAQNRPKTVYLYQRKLLIPDKAGPELRFTNRLLKRQERYSSIFDALGCKS
jgi:hypothetical protein